QHRAVSLHAGHQQSTVRLCVCRRIIPVCCHLCPIAAAIPRFPWFWDRLAMNKNKLSSQVVTVVFNLAVAFVGLLIAYPLIWMVSASFKSIPEIYLFPPTLIPNTPTFANYARLFKDWPFSSWYGNSIAVAIINTLAILFTSSLAGFGFAKYRFKG